MIIIPTEIMFNFKLSVNVMDII